MHSCTSTYSVGTSVHISPSGCRSPPPGEATPLNPHPSCSLNSLAAVIQEIIWGSMRGIIKEDTGSLDYGPHNPSFFFFF